ncbi:MAG: hypothetical protein CVU40_17080 [Chloroflexi bacterium HGW-Chloroflexi-2]|jgi:putative flippase GtrA|nr:MAG: hypothetical protein CVU40_17080 [Chloroflexi bacterium HGW-Chloroflexi-2]
MHTASNHPPTQLPDWIFKYFPRMTGLWLRTPNWFHQAVRFGMVGVINTGVDLGSYWILTRFVPYFISAPVFAKALSYIMGVVNSYIWNRRFTFRSQVRSPRRFVLFFLINLIAVGINSGLMALSLHVLELPEWVGLLMATAITMTWNFTTSKFVIFREPII